MTIGSSKINEVLRLIPIKQVMNYCTNNSCHCMGCVNNVLQSNNITKDEWATWVTANRKRLNIRMSQSGLAIYTLQKDGE